MKIRIQGNKLRLRLSQPELDNFAETGHVTDTITFGPDESQQLTYELIRAEQTAVSAEFSGSEISVYVPSHEALAWTSTSQIGIKASLDNGQQGLQLLIEKDFQCLHKRPEEDESALFPNPAAESTTSSTKES